MSKQGGNIFLGDAIAIPSTTTVYLKSQEIRVGFQFGLWIQLSSSGTPSVQIDVEESYKPPSTEEISDATYVVPDGVASLATIGDKNAHVLGIPLRPMRNFRFKLTGTGSNPSDTTAKAVLFVQQPGS